MKRAVIASLLLLFLLASGALGESAELTRMISAIEPMALGETFSAMEPSQVEEAAGILGEAYEFIGRASESGRYAYLAGSLKGGASPPEIQSTALDFTGAQAEIKIPLPSGRVERFEHINGYVSNEDGSIVYLNLAGVPGMLADSAGEFFKPGGEARLLDMAARGVSLEVPVQAPFACVWLHAVTGNTVEYFLLDEATVAGFENQKKLVERKRQYEEFYGIFYSMEAAPFADVVPDYDYTVPEGLLELAQQKCGYVLIEKFPSKTPTKAELAILSDNGEITVSQTVEDKKQLKELVSIIRKSKPSGGGKHSYNARLALHYDDGSQLVLYKAFDGCPEIIVGSYMIRGLSKKGNAAFDRIFSEVWKERLGTE